jgi:hypothetical protein
MKTFKPGDLVRIVKSPAPERVGQVGRVVSGLKTMQLGSPWIERGHAAPGTRYHELDIESIEFRGLNLGYPPDHLEPYWDGKDASDQTLTEILDGVRGVRTKERAQ